MPYINNDGVQIYYEIDGSGPPLVLHHGVTGGIDRWRASGWDKALRDDYQLIILDARGHGQSAKLPDYQSYSTRHFAGDVIALCNELGIDKMNYFGYSLGGFCGSGLIQYFGDRINVMVLGGIDPAGASGKGVAIVEALRQRFMVGVEHGGEGYVARFGPELTELNREKYLTRSREDFRAYTAVLEALARQQIDFSPAVRQAKFPILFYTGADEEFFGNIVTRGAGDFPNAHHLILPGLNHPQAFERADLVAPYVRAFLAAHVK